MSTGFSPTQSQAILDRDGAMCCLTGRNPECRGRAEVANHRANRGHGGYQAANRIANGCALCHICNGAIESQPDLAALARHLGVKISRDDDPEQVPLWSPFYRQWLILHDDWTDLTGETDPTVRPDLLPIDPETVV